MKKNWTLLVGTLLLSMLALSACSKKGDSGAAAPATGAGGPTQPGTPVPATRGQWGGYVEMVDKQLLKHLLRDTRNCSSSNCRFEGLYLSLRINDQQLPGQGSFVLRTFDYNQWSNHVQWKYSLNKNTVAIPLNNGFQFNHNVNGGGWHGGGPWHNPGHRVCYWRERPRQGTQWWAQLQLNGQGGSVQLGAGNNSRYEYICDEVNYAMQGQSQDAGQAQLGPQVVDPQAAHSMQTQFWAGHQVQITAEYKDASKTCLVVKVYYKGQLAAHGEIQGVVYP